MHSDIQAVDLGGSETARVQAGSIANRGANQAADQNIVALRKVEASVVVR